MIRFHLVRLAIAAILLAMPLAIFAGPAGKARGGGSSIEWQLSVQGHDRVELRVLTPSGDLITRTFKGGQTPTLRLQDLGTEIEDGSYNYELRVYQKISSDVATKLEKARAANDEAAAKKIMKDAGLQAVGLSGGFTVLNNAIVNTEQTEKGAAEEDLPSSVRSEGTGVTPNLQGPGKVAVNDFVIADDLVVQGSTCTGFDCINGEVFSFDTLRLKENNLRIHAEDTSTGVGFPATDWRLTFNDSASGGQNKFSVEDATAATVPVTVEGATPTNSLYVDSTGRIGFRTSAPALDLHVATTNTPAIRLEQTNAGGFTAQTWDIGGNEANFFVRDLTAGSRLPFRIRPGAPTSSIDIAASGNVGVGTASPESRLHLFGSSTADTFLGIGEDPDGSTGTASAFNIGLAGSSFGRGAAFMNTRPDSNAVAPNPSLRFATANVQRMILDNEGFIGLGTTANPDAPIHYTNGVSQARLTTAGVWQDASSRRAKENIAALDTAAALQALAELKPVTYNYKVLPTDGKVGFIAEDVPQLVATPDREGLSALDIVAVVTKVVQDQQKVIDQLNARIAQLEANEQQ